MNIHICKNEIRKLELKIKSFSLERYISRLQFFKGYSFGREQRVNYKC